MTQVNFWKTAKWPLWVGDAILLGCAGLIFFRAPHPFSLHEAVLVSVVVAAGAFLGALPLILEYRAFCKVVEVNALGAAVEQIQNLETIGAKISSATDQWGRMQEAMERHSAKTVVSSQEIAERMSKEVREFNEFMQKINDTEKATLRLEVEKLHRSEKEWLQVLVRILDHIFALHNAASRSGQPELAAQIGNFQNACCGVARRVGLAIFEAEAGKPFDPESHQVSGTEKPPGGSLIAETVGPGYTYQGRLLRLALVRIKGEEAPKIEKPPFEPEPNDKA
jgi:molecular chaperone GrpE (heat shock protein)